MSTDGETALHRLTTPCLLLFAALSFVLSLQVAVAMPPLAQKDERAHAAYAIAVAHGQLPTIDTRIADDPHRYPALAEIQIGEDRAHRDIWTANHPPLYYLLSVPLVWLGDAVGHPGVTLVGMRGLNGLGVALSVLLVGLIARELVPRRPMVAILAAAFAAACPAVTYVGGAIYNDGAATAAAALTLLLALRIIRRGVSGQRVGTLAAAATAAAALRSSGLVAVLVACLAVLAAVLLRDRSRPALWRGVRLAGGVGGTATAAIGWFYLRNIKLYGDATASAALFAKFGRESDGSTLGQLSRGDFYRRLVGSLWTDGDIGNHWALLGAGLMIAAALGLILQIRRRVVAGAWPGSSAGADERRTSRLCWSLLVLYSAIEIASVASFIAGGGWFHARYALPLLPLLATLVAVGLLEVGRLVPRVWAAPDGGARDLVIARPLAMGFVAVMIAAHLDTERYVDGVAHHAARAGLLVAGDLAAVVMAGLVVAELRHRLREESAARMATARSNASRTGSGRGTM